MLIQRHDHEEIGLTEFVHKVSTSKRTGCRATCSVKPLVSAILLLLLLLTLCSTSGV